MMKFYLNQLIKKSSKNVKILGFACLFVLPLSLAAQPSYSFSYSTGNAYAELTGLLPENILLTASKDDELSASTPIGFTFTYNGIDYTTFKVSANGFVNIGATKSGTGYYNNNLSTTSVKPILAPLWDDLYVEDNISPAGSINYKLTGTAGNYVLKIEFKGMSTTYWTINMNFQVWLYEGSNIVEFRYGSMGDWTDANMSASIGINDDYNNEFLSITPGSTPTSSFVTSNNNISSNAYLTSGLMYTFTPVSSITWLGSSTDWNLASNWSSGVKPGTTDNVVIPSGKAFYPVITGSGATGAECQKLIIESGGDVTVTTSGDLTVNGNLHINGSMTVESSETSTSSLIVGSSSTGNIEFQRYLTKDNWHLIACPVFGQTLYNYSSYIATNGTQRAITTYVEASDDWDAYPTSDPGTFFSPGIGYSTLLTSNTTVSFIGRLNTDNTVLSIGRTTGKGWNLIGNPFASAISVNNFLTVNSDSLFAGYKAIYLWDPTAGQYVAVSNGGGQDYIQSGQGFFVKSIDGSHKVNITKAMQSHQNTTPFKSGEKQWPAIRMIATSANNKCTTYISFNSNMTTGVDETYDAGMFKANPDFAFYSRLVSDNGIDYSIQCLPDNYNSLVIPLGIDAPVGTEVTFNADLINLPGECQPYLEDRIAGKFISLSNSGSYSVTIDDRYRGIESLFLHTSNTFVTQNDVVEEINEPFKIITNTKDGFIRVVSKDNQSALAKVYDISGRIVANKEVNYGNNNLIYIPNQPGIYIIQISNEKQNFSQKLMWYK